MKDEGRRTKEEGRRMKRVFFNAVRIFIISSTSSFILNTSSFCADHTPSADGRISIFSTSSDWEAVSGKRFTLNHAKFTTGPFIRNIGWELYFLDGFPCYAQSEHVRTWIAPSRITKIDADGRFDLTCLYRPETVLIAQREADARAYQGRTTNLLTCPMNDNWVIELGECETVPWDRIK